MKAFQLIPDWTETLGWALLNSLWQGMAVVGILYIVLRAVPARSSQLRYVITCCALMSVVLLNAATFIYLLDKNSQAISVVQSFTGRFSGGINQESEQVFSLVSIIESIHAFVSSNMQIFIMGWIAGSLLFSMRMLSGWWYLASLKSEAQILDNDWAIRLSELAQQLGINRLVTLAQSANIHAPMVIGWLKPVVLVPVGMFSGLSYEQVETIFIHELAHIRRHDYIINVLQCVVESLFFFNPFVWIISGWIRREREYCCDDAVLSKHKSPFAYAHALTRLEEQRLSRPVLALTLAENKNQLLDRIKRIMEKSAKQYSARERVVPAVLLIIGLVCASWLTIQTDHGKSQDTLAADTLKKGKKSEGVTRVRIVGVDENGEPKEEVFEYKEGGESFRPMIAHGFEMPVPPTPPVMSMPAMPTMPATPPMPAIPFQYYFGYDTDSIPHRYGRSSLEWKEFSDVFREKFSKQFNDFYREHGKDFDKMMEEMENNFNHVNWENFSSDRLSGDQIAEQMAKFSELMEAQSSENMKLAEEWKLAAGLDALSADQMKEIEEQTQAAQEIIEERMQGWQEEQQKAMEQMQLSFSDQQFHFKEMEDGFKEIESNMKGFEKELKEMLVKDGYIGKDDAIKNINWDDDGDIEVNGKKIKPEHRSKYNELHNSFFKWNGIRRAE